VLIKGPSNVGWWLRNDAVDVAIVPSAHFDHGHARRAGAIVLKSQVRPEKGAKIRWKLVRAPTTRSPATLRPRRPTDRGIHSPQPVL
jgi:uncharacterized heparinase superfamily protein